MTLCFDSFVGCIVLYNYINNCTAGSTCTCTLYSKMERSCNNVKVVCINYGICRGLIDNSNCELWGA